MTDKTPTGETRFVTLAVHCHGKTSALFVRGDVCKDGKVRVSQEAMWLARKLVGATQGECFGVY